MGAINRILDFFFPRICPICGGRLSLSEEELCLNCLLDLPRTAYIQRPRDNYLVGLFLLQVNVIKAVAFMRYQPDLPGSGLLKKIKYRGGKSLAVHMGRVLAEEFLAASPGFFGGVDVIVPMPLTRGRLRHRGYNQSTMIARGVSAVTNIPIDETAVQRVSFHVSQTQLSKFERQENVREAFRCTRPERLRGKHILLIDDVITTGSTLQALAKSIELCAEDVSFTIVTLAATGETRHI